MLGAVLATAGCGLIDSLKNGITFQLPSQAFSIDTNDRRWKQPPPGGVPNVPCGTGSAAVIADCCMPAPGVTIDCAQFPLSCDGGSCAMKFPYEQASPVDLSKQAPELRSIGSQVLSDVTLTQINLDIANALNTALPPIDLYVAPGNVEHASGNGARKLVTIPSVPAGYHGTQQLPLDPAAQQAFSGFARDFQTPFNFIMSTVVTVKGGQAPPQGRLNATVGGEARAKL
jgi:hypothetical protein